MGSLRVQKRLAGQVRQPDPLTHTLSEAFPETATDAAAVGFVLARLPRTTAPILWVQDRLSRKEAGRPYLAGIGTDRPLIMVSLSRAADVLWAMEDGLRCKALGGVIGEVWGDPPVLDFTATKRLAMRSEAADVPCWLIRRAASPDLSAARDRWRIASLPSAPHPHDAQAPGLPRWSLDLFRSRRSKPGQWVATYDRAADRLDLSAAVRDGTLAVGHGTARQRAAG
ncbi:ImuA family protein [Yoonia sp. SDW83-1]|uniref:ImuA family protein n=1 Tax=Yoonia sp. SDW83-1 TaxID=3366945 RepID=UPI00398C789B